MERTKYILYWNHPSVPPHHFRDSGGKEYIRYMDRIFIPAPPYQLSDDAVDELALVRVQHGEEIIDESYTVGVLSDLVLRASRFRSGYRLLDVGCGDGIIVKCLDRLPSNEMSMTQGLIANMLGVRREGVTEAAGKLQKRGVISYRRGYIKVLDRPKLERLSCECYNVVRHETDRLLPYVAPH